MQTHKKILKLPWFWREPRGGIEETLDENSQFRSVQYNDYFMAQISG